MVPRLNKNPKYRQGHYKPINTLKYIGKHIPIYRSGLELKFMIWCDKTETVIHWSSESIQVKYFDSIKKNTRIYMIDNYVEILEGDIVKKYLIEIKPYKQTLQPVTSKGKRKASLLYEQLQWVNNNDKWKFAKDFAKNHGMEFIIITEKELN